MTPENYINEVVGKPWKNRAEGPDQFDCWGLVIDSFRKIEGVEVPQVAGYSDKNCTTHKAASEEIKTGNWARSQPVNGSVMVVKERGNVIHVGRVLHGGVLHTLGVNDMGNTKWSTFKLINQLFNEVEYYSLCL